MKKTLFILFLIPVLLLTGCFLFKDEAQELVMNEMGLDISAARIDFFLNTRKDSSSGITVVEAAFSDSSFASQLQNKEGFQALPFSPELVDVLNSIEPLKGSDGELMIPIADNGYYRFDLNLENSSGQQFSLDQGADLTIALYDGDTNRFHYCHLGIDNLNILSDLQGLIG